ncbi:MAG TPA: hypothetical protein VE172_21620, partial [Stackebrandtia sp.]|uniref:hypothetical protein n=1 Tax=Stackebrandtia sp. TaxID=2023065 RepID=UPI002D522A1A
MAERKEHGTVRIFCGLTGDANGIAAAVTNERGGVIATAEVTDDPYGYLALCRMWVRHSDLASVTVADNGGSRVLRALAAAAGQSIGITDVPHISDPMDSAVHIAQMLAYGDLITGVDSGASAELRKLLTSTHALINSEYAAVASFMEVIRQCHPAVLAAWDEPTDTVALEILRIMPDPAEAAETSPQRIAEALGDIAEPTRLAEQVHKLARAAASRTRQPRPDAGVAGAISAASESVLAAERAAYALATSITEHMEVMGQGASIP